MLGKLLGNGYSMDDLSAKTVLKPMVLGIHHFRKHPNGWETKVHQVLIFSYLHSCEESVVCFHWLHMVKSYCLNILQSPTCCVPWSNLSSRFAEIIKGDTRSVSLVVVPPFASQIPACEYRPSIISIYIIILYIYTQILYRYTYNIYIYI